MKKDVKTTHSNSVGKKIPRAQFSGSLIVGDSELPCYVLDIILDKFHKSKPADTPTYNLYHEQAKKELEDLISRVTTELEKAYGGCHLCYGKGYATTWEGTETRNSHHPELAIAPHQQIKYCTCDRGKQLSEMVSRVTIEAVVKELEFFKHTHTNDTWRVGLKTRIAELTQSKQGDKT